MTVMDNMTTISVTKDTYEKLRALGQMGNSFNDVIERLIEEHKEQKK
jgi:predicted CopG family antitoxin